MVSAPTIIITNKVSFLVPRSSRSHVGTHFPATIITIILYSLAFCSSSLPLLLVTLFYLLSFSFLLLANRLLLVDSCLSILACRLLLVDSCLSTLAFLRLFLVCYLLQTRNSLLAMVSLPATCYRLCYNLLAAAF
ncbi:hypothetical protein Tco_0181177 [Tanacetum coccineum]